MKNIKFLFITLVLLLLSCTKDDSNSEEMEMQNLTERYSEIISASMINNTVCTNSAEWALTTIASKSCGGSFDFIPYSLKINTEEFLKKVQNYNTAQAEFNKKWKKKYCGIVLPTPQIDCINGKPTLINNIAN